MRKTTAQRADIVTLANLTPRRPVVGGSERRVFGDNDDRRTRNTPMATTNRDLPAKKTVKGGKVIGNDTLTIVRAAKPAKKDLPAKKTVSGGRVAYNDNLTHVRATTRSIRTN